MSDAGDRTSVIDARLTRSGLIEPETCGDPNKNRCDREMRLRDQRCSTVFIAGTACTPVENTMVDSKSQWGSPM